MNSRQLQKLGVPEACVKSAIVAIHNFAWKEVHGGRELIVHRKLSAGADEVPGAYKDIEAVMRQQADLVAVLARFDPRIVKMCADGSQAED
jgi:tRNA-splicing ligase RtcB